MADHFCKDYEKHKDYRLFELVCADKHKGDAPSERRRAKAVKWETEGLYIPMACQQCEEAPCMDVCPVKAISRDEETGKVVVDFEICMGCRTCMTVCPFSAMSDNIIDKRVFKLGPCETVPDMSVFAQ